MSLARKRLKRVSYLEPEVWLGLVQTLGWASCGVDSTKGDRGSYSGYRS